MKSSLPKVLHPVGGVPMLLQILQTVSKLKPAKIGVVVGVGREQVKATLGKSGWSQVDLIHQPVPRGSGDAVRQARSWLKRCKGSLLVVYGDTPLLQAGTLEAVVRQQLKEKHGATFLGMEPGDPAGYGRLVINRQGLLEKIVEDKDATVFEKRIRQVNTGVACWAIGPLLSALNRLKPVNAKKEYYLTDAVAILREAGFTVGVSVSKDAQETLGVNTRVELAEAERVVRSRLARHWMLEGVTLEDPQTTYLDSTVLIGTDTRIGPGCILKGKTRVGVGCEIGAYTILEDAILEDGAKVGPFARLRPGSVISEGARVGNFVEVKNTKLGKGSKANHLTYLGDAVVGEDVNIGAGTITCNYDGKKKSQTRIEDQVFIGSNVNLVAPIRVGKGSLVAAGSTLTQDVPARALALARERQQNKLNWMKPS